MKASVALLWTLAGLLGTSVLIGRAVDRRAELRLLPVSVEGDKFAQLQQDAGDYDLVYIGTSRVLRGFDPRAFDQRTAELGRPTSSFNFGLVGLGFLEELFLVEWVLEHRPPGLRWLLIEPTERDVLLQRANQFTLRDIHWHTPAVTARGLGAAWRSNRPLPEKLALTRLHLLSAGSRLFNIGMGAGVLTRWLEPGAPPESLPAGFLGRKPGAEAPAAGSREVRLEREPPPGAPSPVLWEVMAELARRAREAGVEMLFVIPPTPKPMGLFREALAQGRLPGLILYSSSSFPEPFLHHTDYYYDADHLNTRGAELFSRRLAEDFAKRSDDRGEGQ